MSDRWAVMFAAGVACGAQLALPIPVWAMLLTIAAAIATRSRSMCVVAAFGLASVLSASAWQGLDRALPAAVDGVGIVVKDPERAKFGGVRAEVKIDGRHYDVWARGDRATAMERVEAGEHVRVDGRVRPLSGIAAPSLRRRHVAGRIDVASVQAVDEGSVLVRTGNGLRHLIERGAGSLSVDDRALLTGFVYGDDRAESPTVIDQFRDAGLAHLLAVSGQNVAFVLLLAAPILRRFGLTVRFVGGIAVLVLFGVVTRWEPSVVRAEAMASIVLLGVYLGRPVSAVRTLAFGIALAVLGDPFLVGSIGFLLSVTGCCGMVLFGERFSSALPGPTWFRRVLGYSSAAQFGVAPVHLVIFGGMPVAGIVSNLLAEPAAGAVMVWGVLGGITAGVVGEPFASVLHLPTRLLVGWIHGVARHAASAGLGVWTVPRVVLVCTWLALVRWWRVRPQAAAPLASTREQRRAAGVLGQG